MKRYISYALITVAIFSCNKDGFVHPDYLVFGSIQGDCPTCRYVYYLDATKLSEDTTVKYFSNQDLADFKKDLSADKFEVAKNLINQIPETLTNTNKTTFVDINASSPYLWYAEIRLNGRIHMWTFDYAESSTPLYLARFAAPMIATIHRIRQ